MERDALNKLSFFLSLMHFLKIIIIFLKCFDNLCKIWEVLKQGPTSLQSEVFAKD